MYLILLPGYWQLESNPITVTSLGQEDSRQTPKSAGLKDKMSQNIIFGAETFIVSLPIKQVSKHLMKTNKAHKNQKKFPSFLMDDSSFL